MARSERSDEKAPIHQPNDRRFLSVRSRNHESHSILHTGLSAVLAIIKNKQKQAVDAQEDAVHRRAVFRMRGFGQDVEHGDARIQHDPHQTRTPAFQTLLTMLPGFSAMIHRLAFLLAEEQEPGMR